MANRVSISPSTSNINVTQEATKIVKVESRGPKGDKGDPGSDIITAGTSNAYFTNITASGDISASGTIYADSFESITGGNEISFNDDLNVTGDITSSNNLLVRYDMSARSGSFQYITSSVIDVDADTIRIGGTSFSKANLDDLKAGKSIATITKNGFTNFVEAPAFISSISKEPVRTSLLFFRS